MSSPELISLVSELALSYDGAFLGVALAYAAVRTLVKYSSSSSTLRKLRNAPSVKVSDLRSILASDHSNQSQPSDAKLVVVRGTVEAKSAVGSKWNILNLKPGGLFSRGTLNRAVVVQSTQTCVFGELDRILGLRGDEWKDLFVLRPDLKEYSIAFWRSLTEPQSGSTRRVPFVLVERGGGKPSSDSVVVNVDGSKHPLPLTTVYQHLYPVIASPYSSLLALFGYQYPGGVLDQDKILPLGKEITAVGLCSLKNGVPEIESCKDLPYFLSEMSKDEMVADLTPQTNILFWTGVFLGTISFGILGYAFSRNWKKCKVWRQQRQLQQSIHGTDSNAEDQIQEEEDAGDSKRTVDEERGSAFIPCGHLVCCRPCSTPVEREISPKCPVCRHEILISVGLYHGG